MEHDDTARLLMLEHFIKEHGAVIAADSFGRAVIARADGSEYVSGDTLPEAADELFMRSDLH